MLRSSAVTACLALLFCVGCSGSATPPPLPPNPSTATDIAEVHRVRCGNCHTRVDPGMRERAVLEPALLRHRKRVHMTEADWALLLDYLAPPPKAP